MSNRLIAVGLIAIGLVVGVEALYSMFRAGFRISEALMVVVSAVLVFRGVQRIRSQAG